MISFFRRRDEINAGTDLCERCGTITRYHLKLHCWEASLGPWAVQWSKQYYRQCTKCGELTPASGDEALVEQDDVVTLSQPSELEEVRRLHDRVEYAYAMAAGERHGLVHRAHPSVWGLVQEHIGPVAADWLRRVRVPPLEPKSTVRTLEQEFMALATMGYLMFHVERGSGPSGRPIDPTRALRRAERVKAGLSPVVSRLAWDLADKSLQRLHSEGAPLPGKNKKELSRVLIRMIHLGYAVAAEEAFGREA